MFATLIGNISGFMYGKLLIVLLLAEIGRAHV